METTIMGYTGIIWHLGGLGRLKLDLLQHLATSCNVGPVLFASPITKPPDKSCQPASL